MYGSSLGYSSRTLERIARWALDLTLDFAPPDILRFCLASMFVLYRENIAYSFLNIAAVCGVFVLSKSLVSLTSMLSRDAPRFGGADVVARAKETFIIGSYQGHCFVHITNSALFVRWGQGRSCRDTMYN